LFDTMGDLWRDTLNGLLTGLMWERNTALTLASGAPEPSVAEYLKHAFTIGSAFTRSSIWLTSENTDLLPQLEVLTAGLSEAVVAIREIQQRRARCAEVLAPVIQEKNAAAGVLRLIGRTATSAGSKTA